MLEITDKTIIFLCCTSMFLLNCAYGLWIVPILLVLTLSSLNSYFERTVLRNMFFIFYCVLCLFWSNFLMLLPLLLYDVIKNKLRLIYFIALIPIVANKSYLNNSMVITILCFIALTILLKLRTISSSKLKEEYIKLIDNSSEISLLLEEKNAALIANQDHEINVATLSERNRIAREIHDNLGHILSRCLLQMGAILAINKDPVLKELLVAAKDTMAQAMDSVRKSVHNLHDESIDLKEQVHELVKQFSFCPIILDYDINERTETKLKYSLISIIKEALSNIIKHSNATEVYLILKEHPGFYQLIIKDNGTNQKYNAENGIGVRNIMDRVAAFNGNVNITTDNGFKIFISIPKESLK